MGYIEGIMISACITSYVWQALPFLRVISDCSLWDMPAFCALVHTLRVF